MRLRAPFRATRKPPRWTAIQKLIALTWAYVMVPRIVQTLTATKFRLSVGESTGSVYTPIAGLMDGVLRVALIGYCVFLVLSRVRRLPAQRLGALAALLAPWAYLVARDLLNQRGMHTSMVIFGLLVMAVWVVQPRIEDLRVSASFVVATAVLSMLLALLLPDRALFTGADGNPIVPTKALPIGVLVGMLTQGNNLGQVLSIGAPGVLLLPRRRRPVALALLIFALVWTASRSSLLAFVASATAVVVVALAAPLLRAALAGLFTVGSAAIVVLLPLLTKGDDSFTNRGYIWRLSLHAWRDSPTFGLGSNWYSRVGGSSSGIASTAYHGHNELVQLLVTGGWVLCLLTTVLLAVLVVVVSRWAGRGQLYPLGFAVALLISCALEVSLGFVDREFLLPVVTLPLAVILLAPGSDPSIAERQSRFVRQVATPI